MALKPGARVGQWQIEHELGSGAFGIVWGASDVETGEWVAIKTLLDASVKGAEQVARFKREASNLRRVHSDYVGKLIGFLSEDEHGMLLVMEFIEGELLSEILADTSLSILEAVELGMHITRGLCDMHNAGVIHRDIKPSNIMVRPLENGLQRAVIFDLGLSRFNAKEGVKTNENSSSDITATASRMAIGTPGYMAPEQILDARKATAASDVYAAGVVLFRAGCGALPFQGDEHEIAHAKLTQDPPPFDLGRTDSIIERYAAIVDKAIRRRPSERYGTADELLMALTDLREYAVLHARTPSNAPSQGADRDFSSAEIPAPALVDYRTPQRTGVTPATQTTPVVSYVVVGILGGAIVLFILWMFGKIP